MSEIVKFLQSPTFENIHTILFILLLLTPLFISKQNGSLIYYWTLVVLASWGVNDGNCIITNLDNKEEYELQTGLMVRLINNIGIQTSPLSELGIRLTASLLMVCVLYYYSSRNNFQKLIAWCIGWSLITVETYRYIHIKNHDKKVYSFKNRLREFKKKWLT